MEKKDGKPGGQVSGAVGTNVRRAQKTGNLQTFLEYKLGEKKC